MYQKLLRGSAIGLIAVLGWVEFAVSESCLTPEHEDTDWQFNETPRLKNCDAIPHYQAYGHFAPMSESVAARIHVLINSNRANAIATGSDSIAIGGDANASGDFALALGARARVFSSNGVALGSFSTVRSTTGTAVGPGAQIGTNSVQSVSLGMDASVGNDSRAATAIGAFSEVTAPFGVALGVLSEVHARGAVALGETSVADEAYTVSVGRADNPETTLFDEGLYRRITNLAAGETETDAVNLSQLQAVEANVTDLSNTSIANSNQIIQLRGTLDVETRYIDIDGSLAPAEARGVKAIAIGEGARATQINSMAIGAQAQAQFAGSVAFGSQVQTSRNHQFVFGTAQNTYTLPGLNAPASRAAQTGALGLVTVDANGNLASDGGETLATMRQDIAGAQEEIGFLNNRMTVNSTAIEVLQTSVEAGGQQSNENAALIAANQAQIEQTASATRKNASQIQRNQNQIQANTSEIDLLKQQSSGDAARIDGIETQMGEYGTRMDAADETLVKHASQISSNTQAVEAAVSMVHDNQSRIARTEQTLGAQAQSIATMQADFERLGMNVNELAAIVSEGAERIDENSAGVAIANALAGSSWLQANESTAFTVNAGYFDGTSAIAFSGATRLDGKWSANFALGTAPEQGNVGARAGLRFGW